MLFLHRQAKACDDIRSKDDRFSDQPQSIQQRQDGDNVTQQFQYFLGNHTHASPEIRP